MRTALVAAVAAVTVLTTTMPASATRVDRVDVAGCKLDLAEARDLVRQLSSFKGLSSFPYFGFSEPGPHVKWMDRAKRLQRSLEQRSRYAALRSENEDGPFAGADIALLGLAELACETGRACDRKYIIYIRRLVSDSYCASRARP